MVTSAKRCGCACRLPAAPDAAPPGPDAAAARRRWRTSCRPSPACQCWPASTRLAAHGVAGIGEAGVVDHAPPARMALIRHDQRRHAGAKRKPLPLRRRAAQDQRIRRPQHRVQVEQHIDRVDQRPDLARPVELGRAPRAVQHRRVPDPVDVLVDEARRGRLARIEPLVCGEVDEAERQPAARRRRARARSSRSSTIAPAISLPCAIASSATCGPATPESRVVKPRMPVLPAQPAADVGRGETHLE